MFDEQTQQDDSLFGWNMAYFKVQGVQEKLCFSQEFSVFCHFCLASISSAVLLLVTQKMASQYAIGMPVHLHCVGNFEDLLQQYLGEGFQWIGKKTQIFLNTTYI